MRINSPENLYDLIYPKYYDYTIGILLYFFYILNCYWYTVTYHTKPLLKYIYIYGFTL